MKLLPGCSRGWSPRGRRAERWSWTRRRAGPCGTPECHEPGKNGKENWLNTFDWAVKNVDLSFSYLEFKYQREEKDVENQKKSYYINFNCFWWILLEKFSELSRKQPFLLMLFFLCFKNIRHLELFFDSNSLDGIVASKFRTLNRLVIISKLLNYTQIQKFQNF